MCVRIVFSAYLDRLLLRAGGEQELNFQVGGSSTKENCPYRKLIIVKNWSNPGEKTVGTEKKQFNRDKMFSSNPTFSEI